MNYLRKSEREQIINEKKLFVKNLIKFQKNFSSENKKLEFNFRLFFFFYKFFRAFF